MTYERFNAIRLIAINDPQTSIYSGKKLDDLCLNNKLASYSTGRPFDVNTLAFDAFNACK